MEPEPGRAPEPAAAGAVAPVLPPDVTFTRPVIRVHIAVFGVLIPLFILTLSLNPAGFWWARALGCLGAVLVAAAFWRGFRIALHARPDDLVICNFLNTHRIPWAEIAEIGKPNPIAPTTVITNPFYHQDAGLLVRLTDGTAISVTLYDYRYSWDRNRRKLDAAIAELNELRKQRS